MNRLAQLGLVLSYPIIIGLSVHWSASRVEKTLYNRYIIYNEGIILPSKNLETSHTFYATVLDFPTAVPPRRFLGLDTVPFKLTEPQLLHLVDTKAEDLSPIIIIRVRNGFSKLHQELLKRFGKNPQLLDKDSAFQEILPGSVSSIYRGELGDQFITRDPSGNRLLFYQKRLRLF